MKKQLNTEGIINELSGNSAFFKQKPATKDEKKVSIDEASDKPAMQSAGHAIDQKAKQSPEKSVDQQMDRSINQSTRKSTESSVNRPIKRLTNQSIDQSPARSTDDSAIMGKPKGFYISEKQDKDLNRAVELLSNELKGKITQKIDRSTIVRLILERSQVTKKESIMQMADQLINQLVSRLTG